MMVGNAIRQPPRHTRDSQETSSPLISEAGLPKANFQLSVETWSHLNSDTGISTIPGSDRVRRGWRRPYSFAGVFWQRYMALEAPDGLLGARALGLKTRPCSLVHFHQATSQFRLWHLPFCYSSPSSLYMWPGTCNTSTLPDICILSHSTCVSQQG